MRRLPRVDNLFCQPRPSQFSPDPSRTSRGASPGIRSIDLGDDRLLLTSGCETLAAVAEKESATHHAPGCPKTIEQRERNMF